MSRKELGCMGHTETRKASITATATKMLLTVMMMTMQAIRKEKRGGGIKSR